MFGLGKSSMVCAKRINGVEDVNGKLVKTVWEECQRQNEEFEAYSPPAMPNSELVRDCLATTQSLLDKVAFGLAKQVGKEKLALSRFNQKDLDSEKIVANGKN